MLDTPNNADSEPNGNLAALLDQLNSFGKYYAPWGSVEGVKRPLRAGGRAGSTKDPKAWITRPTAVAAAADMRLWPAEKWKGDLKGLVVAEGVGVLTGMIEEGPYAGRRLTVLDLDLACGPDRQPLPWAWDIVHRLPSFWEYSPSGVGLKGFFLTDPVPPPFLINLENKPCKRVGLAAPGAVIPDGVAGLSAHKKPGVDILPERNFATMTLDHLLGTSPLICEVTKEFAEVVAMLASWKRQPRFGRGPSDLDAPILIELGSSPPPFDQERFDELCRIELRFQASFEHRRLDLGDQSLSAFDLSVANFAAEFGWSDAELWRLIIKHRERHGDAKAIKKAFRLDYLLLTIGKAREFARESKARRTAGRGQGG